MKGPLALGSWGIRRFREGLRRRGWHLIPIPTGRSQSDWDSRCAVGGPGEDERSSSNCNGTGFVAFPIPSRSERYGSYDQTVISGVHVRTRGCPISQKSFQVLVA